MQRGSNGRYKDRQENRFISHEKRRDDDGKLFSPFQEPVTYKDIAKQAKEAGLMRDAKADLEICQKATPGPWEAEHRKGANGMYRTEVFSKQHKVIAICAWTPKYCGNGVVKTYREANAEFITLAREALPYWINRAVELERELKRIRLGMGDDYGDDPIKVIQTLKAENKRSRDRLFLKSENAENWDEEREHDD